jgi:protein TonB
MLPFLLLLLPLLAACGSTPVPESPPRQISSSTFYYPEELWDSGVEGETTLRVYVAAQGRVDTARVERSSGYPAFDSAAMRGVGDLRFTPAQGEGGPVGTWVLLPVRFEMNASPRSGDTTPPLPPSR